MFMEVKMLRQEVQMLQQQMNTYAPLADMVPNFASEWLGMLIPIPIPILIPIPGCLGSTAQSLKTMFLVCAGAKIIHGSSSETYQPTENSGILSGITSFLFSSNLRRVVIQVRRSLTSDRWPREPKVSNLDVVLFTQEQTPLHPGNCWCFSGGEGHLVVSLAQPAAVSHVTLGHISKSQSPTGNTSSAPRKFSVYVRNPNSNLLSGEGVDSDSFQPSSSSAPGLVEHQGSRSVPRNRDLQHRRSVIPDVQARGE